MYALLFFLLFCLFATLLWQGLTTGEIKGKGWWGAIRYYSRHDNPFMYWFTAITYFAIVIITLGLSIALMLKA
jgi:hypothetical protein